MKLGLAINPLLFSDEALSCFFLYFEVIIIGHNIAFYLMMINLEILFGKLSLSVE